MLGLWPVIYQACFNKVLSRSNSTRPKQIALSVYSLLSTKLLPVIASKSSSKLCLFLSDYFGFDLIIHSKSIKLALIEAFHAALNHVFLLLRC